MVKNFPANAGDTKNTALIPELGRSLGVGNSNPLQCSCLGNPMDRETWWAIVIGVIKVRHDWACTHACTHTHTELTCTECTLGYKLHRIGPRHKPTSGPFHWLLLLLAMFSPPIPAWLVLCHHLGFGWNIWPLQVVLSHQSFSLYFASILAIKDYIIC